MNRCGHGFAMHKSKVVVLLPQSCFFSIFKEGEPLNPHNKTSPFGHGFSNCHPLVQAIFFFIVCATTFFSTSPVFLTIALLGAGAYTIFLEGWQDGAKRILFCPVIILLMCLINGFFTHDGDTVLFYINSNRITSEGFLFGFWAGVLLAAIMLWLGCFGRLMTSDRLVYLFGRIAPVCGLLISMVFRMLPLLKRRLEQIHIGQQCMGKIPRTPLGKMKQRVKEASILVAWSLENSIETSDSMAARGYGLKGRTSFHLFRFAKRDNILLAVMAVLCAILFVGIALGETTMYFFPRPIWNHWQTQLPYSISFVILVCLPIAVDIQGEHQWKSSFNN